MTSNSTPDKVAVVTGASSGIGAATARALAADGYRVALLARRLDRITTLADEVGNGSIAIEADVTDRDSIVAAADRVRQELGTADALVNNAGVMLLGPFDSGQRADYRQMIEVNLLGHTRRRPITQLPTGSSDGCSTLPRTRTTLLKCSTSSRTEVDEIILTSRSVRRRRRTEASCPTDGIYALPEARVTDALVRHCFGGGWKLLPDPAAGRCIRAHRGQFLRVDSEDQPPPVIRRLPYKVAQQLIVTMYVISP